MHYLHFDFIIATETAMNRKSQTRKRRNEMKISKMSSSRSTITSTVWFEISNFSRIAAGAAAVDRFVAVAIEKLPAQLVCYHYLYAFSTGEMIIFFPFSSNSHSSSTQQPPIHRRSGAHMRWRRARTAANRVCVQDRRSERTYMQSGRVYVALVCAQAVVATILGKRTKLAFSVDDTMRESGGYSQSGDCPFSSNRFELQDHLAQLSGCYGAVLCVWRLIWIKREREYHMEDGEGRTCRQTPNFQWYFIFGVYGLCDVAHMWCGDHSLFIYGFFSRSMFEADSMKKNRRAMGLGSSMANKGWCSRCQRTEYCDSSIDVVDSNQWNRMKKKAMHIVWLRLM